MSSRTDVTKRRLYESAIELIGAKGYEATSISEIVEHAGVAKGTVYYHFTGKAELVEAMIRDQTGGLVEVFQAIEAEHRDDPQRAIEELVGALLSFLTEQDAYSKMLISELWRTDRPWYESLVQMRHDLVNTVCRVVKRGVETGAFRPDIDPDFAGYALFGMTTFCALDRLTHEPHRAFDDLQQQILATSWAALRVC